MQASPSKARAQAVESHEWSIVLSWLSTLYHPRPCPGIEQNASTLRALKSLMANNIAANRLQVLLFEAKCEELAAAERGTTQQPRNRPASLLSLLESSLSEPGLNSLHSLATSAVMLSSNLSTSSSAATSSSLSAQFVDLARQISSLEDHIASSEALILSLQGQTTRTLRDLSAFHANTALLATQESRENSLPSTPTNSTNNGQRADYSNLYARMLQNQRETQQLQLKSAEYKSRIATLESQLAPTDMRSPALLSTTALVSKQQLLHDKKRQIEALEVAFKAFHGLPPDIEASRKEVQRFQRELDSLENRRNELFERM